jgi:hypothetical protein
MDTHLSRQTGIRAVWESPAKFGYGAENSAFLGFLIPMRGGFLISVAGQVDSLEK